MYKIRRTRYKMAKSARIISQPPQSERLSLHTSLLNVNTTLKFHWWVVIGINNTIPIRFGQISTFFPKKTENVLEFVKLLPSNVFFTIIPKIQKVCHEYIFWK